MPRLSKLGRLAVAVILAACGVDAPTTAVPNGQSVLLDIVSGDAQVGTPGAELPMPLVVVAKDSKGHPVKGQFVNFVVVDGGGTMFAGAGVTDNKGQAQDYWMIGGAGEQKVEVRAVDPTTGQKYTYASFTATFTPRAEHKRKRLP